MQVVGQVTLAWALFITFFGYNQAAPPAWTAAYKSVRIKFHASSRIDWRYQVKEYTIFGERVKVGMIEIEFDQELFALKALRTFWFWPFSHYSTSLWARKMSQHYWGWRCSSCYLWYFILFFLSCMLVFDVLPHKYFCWSFSTSPLVQPNTSLVLLPVGRTDGGMTMLRASVGLLLKVSHFLQKIVVCWWKGLFQLNLEVTLKSEEKPILLWEVLYRWKSLTVCRCLAQYGWCSSSRRLWPPQFQ